MMTIDANILLRSWETRSSPFTTMKASYLSAWKMRTATTVPSEMSAGTCEEPEMRRAGDCIGPSLEGH